MSKSSYLHYIRLKKDPESREKSGWADETFMTDLLWRQTPRVAESFARGYGRTLSLKL